MSRNKSTQKKYPIFNSGKVVKHFRVDATCNDDTDDDEEDELKKLLDFWLTTTELDKELAKLDELIELEKKLEHK